MAATSNPESLVPPPPPPPIFTSLGMFIIDEIHYPDKPSKYNVLGGGGFFALLGSRIALSFNNTRLASFIMDAGSDFPAEVEAKLASWQTGTVIRKDDTRLTTRGWNKYYDNDYRVFKYLAPKKRIDVEDLVANEPLIESRSFHFICSPDRCTEMVKKLENVKRQSLASSSESLPVICWEPIPDLCTPENLDSCLKILHKVDILSPNAEEAAHFFGLKEPQTKLELEQIAQRYIPYLTKNTLAGLGACILLRCGSLGVFVLSNKGYSKWFPAYQAVNPEPKIVDCTGAGNTTCSSFVTALVVSRDWEVAGIVSNVAAGLCLEQLAVPEVSDKSIWNGTELQERIAKYLQWSGLEYDVDAVVEKLS